jgi:gliding motility-associated-like protein
MLQPSSNKLFKLLFIAIWLCSSLVSKATHIVGGEIFYEAMPNNNYLITLIVYRDCGPTNINQTDFDQSASVGIFSTTSGNLYDNVLIQLIESNVSEVPIVLENPCFVLPPDLCVEQAIYQTTVNLPETPGGFTLVYQRCCRNPSIVNLDFPDDTGITVATEIPGTNTTPNPNSSASFNNFPPVALCAGAEFFFDHSAADTDGDSLVYEFCSPMHGASPDNPAPQPPDNPPYTFVNWANTFSSSYQITSNPSFEIDPVTGYITGTPTQIGQYVIGICVSEYRDGVLINSSNRDFQFNVTLCDPNIIASIPQQTNFCDGLSIQFESESTNASFFHWDFGVEGIDNDTSNVANPFFVYPDQGVYEIMLIANPGWPCADTALSSYSALPVITPNISLGEYECVNNQDHYSFLLTANASNNAQYTWNFGPGASPQTSSLQNPTDIILNPEVATNTVSVTVIDNGCEESDNLDVVNPPDPVAAIVPQESFCDGYTYTFEHNSTDADSYFWNFNTPINGDQSIFESPTFTFPDSGWYNITLIASADFACPDTANMWFEIYALLDPSFEELEAQCLSVNSFDFVATGATSDESTISWDFGPLASSPSSSVLNPQNISFPAADTYPVTLTISENGCVRTYTDFVWVAEDPSINASLANTTGCPDLYVNFDADGQSETQLFYNWNFGDGTSSTAENPMHVYSYPGEYDVTVTAYTVNGCIATLTQQFNNAVIVNPIPTPGFYITPEVIDILNPSISVIDTSYNSISCYYYMSDGGSSDECDFNYTWTEAGSQIITQYVINEFGCAANITARVIIEGYMFFAPNSFTPNGDGMNDYWLPKMTGIDAYHCVIYDRWGTLIFESFDQNQVWIGDVRNGEYFAQDGIYQYHVRVQDQVGLSHEFSGFVNILR